MQFDTLSSNTPLYFQKSQKFGIAEWWKVHFNLFWWLPSCSASSAFSVIQPSESKIAFLGFILNIGYLATPLSLRTVSICIWEFQLARQVWAQWADVIRAQNYLQFVAILVQGHCHREPCIFHGVGVSPQQINFFEFNSISFLLRWGLVMVILCPEADSGIVRPVRSTVHEI